MRDAIARAQGWERLGLGKEDHLCWCAYDKGPDGTVNARFEQVFRGVNVVGSEVRLEIKAGGQVSFSAIRVFGRIGIDTVPGISLTEAREKARQAVPELASSREFLGTRLVVAPRKPAGTGPWVFRLAYLVLDGARGKLEGERYGCLVDAKSGEIIEARPNWSPLPHDGPLITP